MTFEKYITLFIRITKLTIKFIVRYFYIKPKVIIIDQQIDLYLD